MNRCAYRLALIPLLLLAACGEFSYKRGAGAGDLQQARTECAAAGIPAAEMDRCLNDKGWSVTRFDRSSPVAVIAVNPDNRSSAPLPPPAAAGGTTGSQAAAGDPAAPPDPMQTFNVASWWKMGGNAADLDKSMSACADRLGDSHRPAPGSHLYTRAMVLCLKEFGWTGLQDYAPTK